jgi:predicted permease
MRELLRRIWYLLNRHRIERELTEEMAYHRELMEVDRRDEFGSELRAREITREVWGWAWLDRLTQDLAYGARVLRNSPGFTMTAMLVLALGIGVPLTAFRAVLVDLQGGAAPDPDTLVRLARRAPDAYITVLPYPELAYYAANARSFRSVIGISGRNQAVFGDTAPGGTPEQVQLAFATSNYFAEFGIVPVRGRMLTADDDRPDAEAVALLGEGFWQRRLGGDPNAIGQTIRVNGKLVRVVGVIPAAYQNHGEIWMPLARQPYVVEGSTLFTDWNSALDLYARLKPGVSPKAAEQETLALAARLRELQPDHVRPGEQLEVRPIFKFDTSSHEFQTILTAALLVIMLLVAACANLGTLVLARGAKREREIRIRMALGAGRMRVVRQLFTESLLLAAMSALCALLLSSVAMKVIQLQHNSTIASGLFPGWTVLAATAAVALVTALVFGLPPAFRLTSLVPRVARTQSIFLAGQVAAGSLLLVVASLLVGSVQRLGAADAGFDYAHLILVSPGLKSHGYGGPGARSYLDSLRTRVVEMQGVKDASVAWLAPWGNSHMGAAWAGRQFAGNRVDEHFLDTMGMRMVRGRNFRPNEAGVALISEAAARAMWPDGDALGKPLPWEAPGTLVIGVVRNASTSRVGIREPLEYYLPVTRGDAPESVLMVRVAGRPNDSVLRLQESARALDARLQPTAQTLSGAYDRAVQQLSNALAVVSFLGAVAILLSAIGLAGLAGYTVAQRTREIGVRIALGARPRQIVRAILAPMTRPIAIGFACGALAGTAAAKIMRSEIAGMAGVDPMDVFAYLMALAFFGAVIALAVSVPGRRAIRINPSKALQHE